jgi:hypothetical protein
MLAMAPPPFIHQMSVTRQSSGKSMRNLCWSKRARRLIPIITDEYPGSDLCLRGKDHGARHFNDYCRQAG